MKEKNNQDDNDVIIELKDIWKIYKMGEVEVPALRGVSLQIRKGDFVAIIGASGSGKSTMMNMVGCLDIPTRGDIFLKSKNLTDLSESDLASLRGKTIGFVFQQYNLIPTMTALENVMLPLDLQEEDSSYSVSRAKECLNKVGLGDKINNLPSQMSGGQQQRVSVARALACDPEIILADEPTGALDSKTGKEVISMLKTLCEQEKKTLVIVTHDLKLASYAHTHVELRDGQVIRETNNSHMTDIKLTGSD